MFGLNEKKFSILMLGCVFATTFSSCASNANSKENIVITASSENTERLSQVAAQFNKQNSKYVISFETYKNETVKNYYLSHDKTKGDIFAFDYCSVGQNYADKLMNLNRFDVTDKYQVNIKNYIRDINGDLYFLPSPGAFYSYCFNTNLLYYRSLNVPNTLSELLTLADRLSSYEYGKDYAISATSGGNNSVLCALMSIVGPSVINSIKDNSFFRDYLSGKVKMADDENRSSWAQIFMYLSSLYELKYYSLNDLSTNKEEGFNNFKNENTYAMLNTPDVNRVLTSDEKFELSPFVGEKEDEKCIGTTPLYYLGISNKVSVSSKKYQGIKDFFNYYSSKEGQSYVLQYNGSSRVNHISYLKENQNVLTEKYLILEKYINSGKMFYADYFFAIFKENVDLLVQYLTAKISTLTLINSLDEYVSKMIDTSLIETYEVHNNYDFDTLGETITTQKSKIGSLYISLLSNAIGYGKDCTLLVPSTILNANLFKGQITEKELDIVFQDISLQYCIVNGSALKKYINDNKGFMFLSNNIEVALNSMLYNNQPISDTTQYFVLLPKDDLSKFHQGDLISTNGKVISSNEEIKNYLSKVKTLD